jgi:hypothetical protein
LNLHHFDARRGLLSRSGELSLGECLRKACYILYSAATAKESGMALRATERNEDALTHRRFFKNGLFVASMDPVAWATSSTESGCDPFVHQVLQTATAVVLAQAG